MTLTRAAVTDCKGWSQWNGFRKRFQEGNPPTFDIRHPPLPGLGGEGKPPDPRGRVSYATSSVQSDEDVTDGGSASPIALRSGPVASIQPCWWWTDAS